MPDSTGPGHPHTGQCGAQAPGWGVGLSSPGLSLASGWLFPSPVWDEHPRGRRRVRTGRAARCTAVANPWCDL